ncbi:hypothetical protein sS8_1005 [Methylocaldum marinum]|uniref:Uncharacterized protein n=1 Tax=Methylocaldum marinum TaxID=1432792 RepID=A0A250KMP3_9GAMM|nr:hypothetical protein sS8_1005 [Methylocaldum marinum]
MDRTTQIPLLHTDYRCGASSTATGQGLTGPAFENAQPDMMSVDHLHKADIGALRKNRMALQDRSQSFDRCTIDIIDFDYNMRITHRYRTEKPKISVGLHGIQSGFVCGVQWDLAGLVLRDAHIDGHESTFSMEQTQLPGIRVNYDLILVAQAVVANEPGEATGTVSALRHFATIRIEDPVTKVGI